MEFISFNFGTGTWDMVNSEFVSGFMIVGTFWENFSITFFSFVRLLISFSSRVTLFNFSSKIGILISSLGSSFSTIRSILFSFRLSGINEVWIVLSYWMIHGLLELLITFLMLL